MEFLDDFTDESGEPPLSRREELVIAQNVLPQKVLIPLIEKAQQGEQRALDTVVSHNEKMVRKIVHVFKGIRHLPIDEMLQEGRIGLIEAVQLFDLKKNVQFSTFAYLYIRGRILQYINRSSFQVSVPRPIKERAEELRKHLSRNPAQQRLNSTELARSLGWSLDEVFEARELLEHKVLTLSGTGTAEDEEDDSLRLTDPHAYDPLVTAIAHQELVSSASAIAKELCLIERTFDLEKLGIYIVRFGMTTYGEPVSYDKVGEYFLISRERVRVVLRAILKKIERTDSEIGDTMERIALLAETFGVTAGEVVLAHYRSVSGHEYRIPPIARR